MAEIVVTDEDRECIGRMTTEPVLSNCSPSAVAGQLGPIVAAHRQAAEDRVARRAFAAGCSRCKRGLPVVMAGYEWCDDPMQLWSHRQDGDLAPCGSHHIRLALDPTGRLSGREGGEGGDDV